MPGAKQHCVFKWNSWIFDPDDGSIESFDDFAQNHDCKSGSIAVCSSPLPLAVAGWQVAALLVLIYAYK